MKAAKIAESGIVKIQAQRTFPATPQRTADKRCVAPTPTIAPVIVCVVLTGIPANAVPNRVSAEPVSAQNPPTGLSLVNFCPSVPITFQPPAIVPKAMVK